MCKNIHSSTIFNRIKKIRLSWRLSGKEFLGQEDPIEEGMATYSNILFWRIPWLEETGRLPSMGSQKSRIPLSDKISKENC